MNKIVFVLAAATVMSACAATRDPTPSNGTIPGGGNPLEPIRPTKPSGK